MDKLGRNYILSVGLNNGDTLTILPPFTIEFDIIRNSLSSANTSSIRVYNLSKDNRNKIRKDAFNTTDKRLIGLRAGYGDNMPIIFGGFISQAWSVREGVDFVTQIESFDGGFAYNNAITDTSFTAGSTQQSIVDSMVGSLKQFGVEKGAVGKIDGTLARGNSYSGSTTEILKQITGGSFFIDNNKAYVLADNEAIDGEIQVINSATGLLNTPVREQLYLNFDVIFEPRLTVAQKLKLESTTDESFNSFVKVLSIRHHGMISEAVCGDCITSVGVIPPAFLETVQT